MGLEGPIEERAKVYESMKFAGRKCPGKDTPSQTWEAAEEYEQAIQGEYAPHRLLIAGILGGRLVSSAGDVRRAAAAFRAV